MTACRFMVVKREVKSQFGKFLWALVDTGQPIKDDDSGFGYAVITTAYGNNPIRAPERLIRRRGELNTANILG